MEIIKRCNFQDVCLDMGAVRKREAFSSPEFTGLRADALIRDQNSKWQVGALVRVGQGGLWYQH